MQLPTRLAFSSPRASMNRLKILVKYSIRDDDSNIVHREMPFVSCD